jgi:ribose 5-phosphate isomerase B
MRIAIASDHAGFALKEQLKRRLADEGYEVVDFGTDSDTSCDYPDFAQAAAHDVGTGNSDRGVLVCSTGVGMSMAANKVAGVRAVLAMSEDEIVLTREHNDANVITFGSRYFDETGAMDLVHLFLETEFLGGRHSRRIAKLALLDRGRS